MAFAVRRDGSREDFVQGAAQGAPGTAAAAAGEEESAEATRSPARSRGGFPASKPMHRCAQPSFLSAEESPKQNYRGLFNLAALILVVSNLRMFLQNFLVRFLHAPTDSTDVRTPLDALNEYVAAVGA